jgi:hypothetical protein
VGRFSVWSLEFGVTSSSWQLAGAWFRVPSSGSITNDQ